MTALQILAVIWFMGFSYHGYHLFSGVPDYVSKAPANFRIPCYVLMMAKTLVLWPVWTVTDIRTALRDRASK